VTGQEAVLVYTETFSNLFLESEAVLSNKCKVSWCGGMAEWLICQTNNLMIASCMGSNPVSLCFLEQETLHTLLGTGWFQERLRQCVYKLIASYTIELK
jgi:hypothetical protein